MPKSHPLLEACKLGFNAKPGERCPYKAGSELAKWWTHWRDKRHKRKEVQEEAA